ncbi:MAG: DUF4296 domain-containing protein [Bacteroides sp.]|nr:DUF4296 domain-containing protein [Bacteroides sp.]
MSKSVRKYGFWALLAVVMVACKVERPGYVLSDGVMEKVLYDYHIAKAMGENLDYNEQYKRTLYLNAVFKKHNITQAQFDTTMAWYARHPEVVNEVYDIVRERLMASRENYNHLVSLRDGKPTRSKAGDSIDVWIWDRIHMLSGMPLDNKLMFTLPSDDNYQASDTIKWTVGFNFLSEQLVDTTKRPVMAMQVAYAKDTIISALCRIDSSQVAQLVLQADTLGDIKELRGFIYYPTNQPKQTLLIDSVSLMRYHQTNDSIPATTDDKKEEKIELEVPQASQRKIQPTELK